MRTIKFKFATHQLSDLSTLAISVKPRKRDRITYSQRQLDLLEDVFRQSKYPDYDVRVELERQSKLVGRNNNIQSEYIYFFYLCINYINIFLF